MLTEKGYDVFSAMEKAPRASDEVLLALANEEQRILITEDKDFGDLMFVQRLPAVSSNLPMSGSSGGSISMTRAKNTTI